MLMLMLLLLLDQLPLSQQVMPSIILLITVNFGQDHSMDYKLMRSPLKITFFLPALTVMTSSTQLIMGLTGEHLPLLSLMLFMQSV
jgi:hypothetical protein